MSGKGPESPSRPNGWLSRCLRWPYLLTFGLLDIAMTITIIALTIKSSQKGGSATLATHNTTSADQNSVTFNVPWNLGFAPDLPPQFRLLPFRRVLDVDCELGSQNGNRTRRAAQSRRRRRRGVGSSWTIALSPPSGAGGEPFESRTTRGQTSERSSLFRSHVAGLDGLPHCSS
ncbi:hypothetical protein CTA1_3982 [Colletotrichum tanaceti]|uniref:Uncharacterized protein n=1 Tax=Colletotrichum tanaceti TaxID=1306861 RepID=A0A4U6XGD6_9PEZI|nr:hypothetical protein CTA1_3982 [Colletotrichum tanaceti]